ncbi:MAG: DsrE/DsrF/DrsH-like family protein [Chloroflexota bacterium]|nr:DsrE/DsrF/DrsH-like family protein [Chloroflexota bacterium]
MSPVQVRGLQDNETIYKYIDDLVTARVAAEFDDLRRSIGESFSVSPNPQMQALSNRATIVVFSGDMDKLMSAFIIATGAATMDMEVSMYFTFWGLVALKKTTIFRGKPMMEKMMAFMLPSGPRKVGTSKMNMLGIGPAFFKKAMNKNNVEKLPELIDVAREVGVRMVACQMSMGVMGIKREELIDGLEFGGVGAYMGDASDSKITLFI